MTEIATLRARVERLRATLESRSVVLMGPRSPFWRCQYCEAMATSPMLFQHKPDCLVAREPDAAAAETVCLSALASNEPCRPDETLRRCAICGFIVDTKYAAEKPMIQGRVT